MHILKEFLNCRALRIIVYLSDPVSVRIMHIEEKTIKFINSFVDQQFPADVVRIVFFDG